MISTQLLQKTIFASVFILASQVHCLLADSIPLPNPLIIEGTEYNKPVYRSHDNIWLKFTHEAGMAKVRIESLSPEIKQLLGYDARLATQQNERDTADNARRAQAAQAAASKLASKLETLHGIVVRNSTKGIVIETRKSTGEKRSVSEWSNNNNRLERREEEVYQTVHYCVCGIPNAEYIKPGTRFDIEVLPEKLDYIDGSPIMVATFIRELK